MKRFLIVFGLFVFTWISLGTYTPNSFFQFNGRLTNDWTTTATTVSNVTGMNFPVQANEVWSYDFVLRIGSSSTAGIKFAINFPSGAANMCTVNGTTNAINTATTSIITAAATLTTEVYMALATQNGIAY